MLSTDLFLNICEHLNYDEFEIIVSILYPVNRKEITLLFIQRKTKITNYENLEYISKHYSYLSELCIFYS